MLGLAIAFVGTACFAQRTTIPFKQIEKESNLSLAMTLPVSGMSSSLDANSLSSGFSSSESSGASFTRATPTAARRRTLDTGFYLLNGLDIGVAVLDVEMTQHCIATHQCREGNPLMPSSQAGALSVSLGLAGYSTWLGYHLKKHESRIWWLAPTSGIAGHVVGVATGLAHR